MPDSLTRTASPPADPYFSFSPGVGSQAAAMIRLSRLSPSLSLFLDGMGVSRYSLGCIVAAVFAAELCVVV